MRWWLIAVLLSAGPVMAERWTCALAEKGSTGLIAPEITFEVTGVYKDVRVTDALIAAELGDWTAGKLQKMNDKRITVTWQVPNMRPKLSRTQFRTQFTGSFSLTVMQKDGQAKAFMMQVVS
jgi:hypothetical protein